MSTSFEAPIVIWDRANIYQPSGQCDCDCDCACSIFSDSPNNQNEYLKALEFESIPPLHRLTPSHAISLDNNYNIHFGPHHLPVVLNRSATDILSEFDKSPHLRDIGGKLRKKIGDEAIRATVAEMVSVRLLVPEDYVDPPVAETSTTLAAWLHISDRCNLRCSYCYLPHAPADMSFDVGFAAIDATFRSALVHHYRRVKLKYAGGEAMLRFPFIAELQTYARNRASKLGLELDCVILSNGTLLTEKIVNSMLSLDLRLMISLDGLSETHDRHRPFAGGGNSSAIVTQAVDLALENGLVPDISITISKRNVNGLPELIEWVLKRNLPFSLNFYRENDLSISTKDLRLEQDCIIDGMLATYKIIEANLPRHSLLASLADFANLSVPHLKTCNVGHSYLVFDHQGNVAKCQMQINKPITTANALDPLQLIRADEIGIKNISVEEKEGCRTCEWKYWCTGGCPLATFRATGRYDIKSPNCEIYKALYPEVMRLEGLRLLKYRKNLHRSS